jgi:hypothetical protein
MTALPGRVITGGEVKVMLKLVYIIIIIIIIKSQSLLLGKIQNCWLNFAQDRV